MKIAQFNLFKLTLGYFAYGIKKKLNKKRKIITTMRKQSLWYVTITTATKRKNSVSVTFYIGDHFVENETLFFTDLSRLSNSQA